MAWQWLEEKVIFNQFISVLGHMGLSATLAFCCCPQVEFKAERGAAGVPRSIDQRDERDLFELILFSYIEIYPPATSTYGIHFQLENQ